jgi:membrane-associated two-gene conflict system component 1 (EACC1)
MDGELRVQLSEEGADAERLDELTRSLRHELLQLDVDDVTAQRADSPPPGARGGLDAAQVGGLMVAVGNNVQGLSAVIAAIRAWLARRRGAHRCVRPEIAGDVLELSDATVADQDQLIRLFVGRHAAGA